MRRTLILLLVTAIWLPAVGVQPDVPLAGGVGRGGVGGTLQPTGDYRITVDLGGQQQTTIGRIRERIR